MGASERPEAAAFPLPGNHALGRVHVGDAGPGFSGTERCASGIGEQIQNLQRPAGLTDDVRKPVPVYRLFGK